MNITSKLICIIIACLFTSSSFATSLQFGVTLPFLIKGKDPEGVHGYRAIAWYQPESLIWPHLQVYFAGSVGHWWAQGAKTDRSLNILAIAPVLRYYFVKHPTISPYVEASIGASYLSRTHFANSNLGMHFSFQDELGIGAAFGREQRAYASLSALHYSNGSLSAHNAGITIPLILNIGYQFG